VDELRKYDYQKLTLGMQVMHCELTKRKLKQSILTYTERDK